MTPQGCDASGYATVSYLFDSQMHMEPEDALVGCIEYPGSPCPHYMNNVNYFRYFIANKNVSSIDFYYDKFDTENCCDPMKSGTYRTTHSPLTDVRGALPAGWKNGIALTTTDSLQKSQAYLNFVTDPSVTWSGFRIGLLKVGCFGTNDAENALLKHRRYTGVLLGKDDVVYTQFPAEEGHTTVALWHEDTNTDFDLYLRCTDRPTEAAWYKRPYKGLGHSEFVHLNEGEGCPVGGTWRVAVHSYSGRGAFHLMVSRHKSTEHIETHAGPQLGWTGGDPARVKFDRGNVCARGNRTQLRVDHARSRHGEHDLYAEA